jgi:hypothetical protein
MGVSAIAFTAVALTTATFAWFEIYSEVKVQGLNITATSGLGFMISVDGNTYKNDLTEDEIYGAMLVSAKPNEFGWHYDAVTKTTELWTKIATPIYDDQNQLTGYEYTLDQAASKQTREQALKDIELMPLTSKDGVNLTDLFNSGASAGSGRFIEFSVYFRTTGTRGEYREATEIVAGNRYFQRTGEYYVNVDQLGITLTDSNVSQYYYKVHESDPIDENNIGLTKYDPENLTKGYTFYKKFYNVVDVTENAQGLLVQYELDHQNPVYELVNGYQYEIYLNGEEQVSDSSGLVTTISPTRFTADVINGNVGANMTAYQNGQLLELKGPTDTKPVGDPFTVYGANALRMSITDENAKSASSGATGTLIYELNDYVNGAMDLGSYATTYSATNWAGFSDSYDIDLDHKYGHDFSASYTYYTNLKQNDSLAGYLMNLDEIPTTISDLTSKDNEGNYIYNKKITTLSSGEDGKLITFRIWLEGWDADCFDGLGGTIQSQLSFSSKRIK